MSNRSKTTIDDLIHYLNNSPTAWHAVANAAATLVKHGFHELKESEVWHVKPGGHYYVIRNGSSICAFIMPKNSPTHAHVIASHTDSPSFKLKPNAEFQKENMTMLGLEIYGSPLLASWLNRDLGIAGRVVYFDMNGHLHESLVNIKDKPVVIPQLAIHLDRNVNESGPVLNKQEHLAALAGLSNKKRSKESFLDRALKKSLAINELLSFDLFLYPLEQAKIIGDNHEMLSSYRIDNLTSSQAGLQAIIHAKASTDSQIKTLVLWDNEEIGSNSAQGAGSPFLPHLLERITTSQNLSREDYFRILSKSLCTSVDLGHALHPNYSDRHEPRHQALLGKGILIKTNAQQRYASDAKSVATILAMCKKNNIPYQLYVSRGDIPCGTTVGPIHANLTGMPTIDIGCAQLSMHSCREVMALEDHLSMIELLKAFLS